MSDVGCGCECTTCRKDRHCHRFYCSPAPRTIMVGGFAPNGEGPNNRMVALVANLRARLDRLTHAAREVCRVVPPPDDGHARHTKVVLVVDALRDVLRKGEGLQ